MENLKLERQEKNYLKLNRIILTVIFGIFTILPILGIIFKPIFWWQFGIAILVIWSLYLLIFIYLGAAFRHFSYAMDDFGLYINQGVFWHKKIIVPRNRVQHTDVMQGPFERKYNLAQLIVHTAGTRNASVRLPGILHEHAETLRESLSFKESNDAV